MPVTMLPSFLLYCFTGGITPGPANLCSLSAALRYGPGAALRQWRGLFTGFLLISLVSVAITWRLGAALGQYVGMLSWLGAVYMLWLAWHIARSPKSGAAKDRPHFPDRAAYQPDKCENHDFLSDRVERLCAALYPILLGPAGRGAVSPLHWAGLQPGMALCWGLPAVPVHQPPQGGRYHNGRRPSPVRV